MKILVELTYYRPHTSGLTIYAERLAKALVERGHAVTILTSQYEKELAREEILEGVRVVRAPVWLRISKGVIMPTFGWLATKLTFQHDVIHLHLPQFDAAGLALRGRLLRKPTVITYHCDLLMPRGWLSWLANQAVHIMNHIAGFFTHRIVAYTKDYAEHSPFLNRFVRKLEVIHPPVVLPKASPKKIEGFKKLHNPNDQHPVIGMAARFATEKGIEVLLTSMGKITQIYPQALVLFAGPYEHILGEEAYFQRLSSQIERLKTSGNWCFLGLLSAQEMAAFYKNLDILVVPSLNSTEAFGLVQIEAMMNGVPCIASDLPGVRQPLRGQKMVSVDPIGDSDALSDAILKVTSMRKKITATQEDLKNLYAPDTVAKEYERLFASIFTQIQKPQP